jgi:hypothetical protein
LSWSPFSKLSKTKLIKDGSFSPSGKIAKNRGVKKFDFCVSFQAILGEFGSGPIPANPQNPQKGGRLDKTA